MKKIGSRLVATAVIAATFAPSAIGASWGTDTVYRNDLSRAQAYGTIYRTSKPSLFAAANLRDVRPTDSFPALMKNDWYEFYSNAWHGPTKDTRQTTSSSYQAYNDERGLPAGIASFREVRTRICVNVNNWPDSCATEHTGRASR